MRLILITMFTLCLAVTSSLKIPHSLLKRAKFKAGKEMLPQFLPDKTLSDVIAWKNSIKSQNASENRLPLGLHKNESMSTFLRDQDLKTPSLNYVLDMYLEKSGKTSISGVADDSDGHHRRVESADVIESYKSIELTNSSNKFEKSFQINLTSVNWSNVLGAEYLVEIFINKLQLKSFKQENHVFEIFPRSTGESSYVINRNINNISEKKRFETSNCIMQNKTSGIHRCWMAVDASSEVLSTMDPKLLTITLKFSNPRDSGKVTWLFASRQAQQDGTVNAMNVAGLNLILYSKFDVLDTSLIGQLRIVNNGKLLTENSFDFERSRRKRESPSKGGNQKSNRRRNTSDKNKKNRRKDSRCRRRSLIVDFDELGWSDWIIAPTSYQAYYCGGDCPFTLSSDLNTTNHAILQMRVHSMSPSGHIPRPCCVPTSLSPISILYKSDSGTITLTNYGNMVVDACGCR